MNEIKKYRTKQRNNEITKHRENERHKENNHEGTK